MSATELTAYIGLVVAVVSTIVIPWVLRRRKAHSSAGKADTLNWANMNRSLAEREVRLQKRLDEIDADYIDRIKTIRNDFEDQLHAERARYETNLQDARTRIQELEQEVATLRRIVSGGKA
jgi:archaellum component FlaC